MGRRGESPPSDPSPPCRLHTPSRLRAATSAPRARRLGGTRGSRQAPAARTFAHDEDGRIEGRSVIHGIDEPDDALLRGGATRDEARVVALILSGIDVAPARF